MVKISAILVLLGAYFGLFVFGLWYAHIPVQAGLLLLFLLLDTLWHGLRSRGLINSHVAGLTVCHSSRSG